MIRMGPFQLGIFYGSTISFPGSTPAACGSPRGTGAKHMGRSRPPGRQPVGPHRAENTGAHLCCAPPFHQGWGGAGRARG